MRTIKGFSFLVILLMSSTLIAQVNFEAKISKDSIGLYETIQVDFEISQDEDRFTPPDFNDFKVVSGPNKAISNSWINGERTYKKTFTYKIIPKKEGELLISKAQISIGAKTFETQPLKVMVSHSSKSEANSRLEADSKREVDVHLVAQISDNTIGLGQSTEVTYKLYVSQSVGISNWKPLEKQKYINFTSQDIEMSPMEVKTEKFNGEMYRYVILNKVKLTSKAIGDFKIDALKLNVTVEVPSKKKDIFGGRVMETLNMNIKSEPLEIIVK
jgi:hypothetical protein